MSQTSEIKSPGEEELSRLSREALSAYAARCALRALPLTTFREKPGFGPDSGKHMRGVEAGVLAAALHAHPEYRPASTVQAAAAVAAAKAAAGVASGISSSSYEMAFYIADDDIFASAADRAAMIETLVESAYPGDDGDSAYDAVVNYAFFAIRDAAEAAAAAGEAVSAGDGAAAFRAELEATGAVGYALRSSVEEAVFRDTHDSSAASRAASRVWLAARDAAAAAAGADFDYLRQVDDPSALFRQPLWPHGEPDGWQEWLRKWKDALQGEGIGEMFQRFRSFDRGEPDWSGCADALDRWYREFGREYERAE